MTLLRFLARTTRPAVLIALLCLLGGLPDGVAAQTPPSASEDAAAEGEPALSVDAAQEGAETAAETLETAVEAAQEVESQTDAADGTTADNAPSAEAEAAAEAVIEAAINEDVRDEASGLPAELLDPGLETQELELRLVPLTQGELGTLAAAWLEIVRSKTEEVTAVQVAIFRTEGDVAAAARERLTDLVHDRKILFDKFSKIVTAWEKKGGDEAAIAEMRAYRASVIIEETRTADVQTLLAQALEWATARDGGIQLAIDIAVIIASLVGLVIVARVVRRVMRRYIGRVPQLSKLLQVFVVGVVYWLVMAFGLMVVLSGLGIDISPVFALIGGASFILAFAFQDTLGNLASGLMIMLNRPFDEGDYVDIGGVGGTVKAVSIVATTVVTADNQVIVIPNKNVWGNVITNVTASETRRVDLIFGIGYADDIPHAKSVIEETVSAHPLVLDDPAPMVRVHELADNSVNFICRPWTKTGDYWTVYWDLMQTMKMRFDEAGISIPFPQRDIHVHGIPALAAAMPAAAAPAPSGSTSSAAPEVQDSRPGSFARDDEGHDAEVESEER